ncbi:MAG: hypothetical protein ACJAYX_001019 [Planctomycetota bacterium]|jgi:hypothetical protein
MRVLDDWFAREVALARLRAMEFATQCLQFATQHLQLAAKHLVGRRNLIKQRMRPRF